MVMSLTQALKLGENLCSSSLPEQAETCLCDSVLSKPCHLICRQGWSQASSSPPLPSNIRFVIVFPLSHSPVAFLLL